jgi:3-hydroxy-9,10-secoandrosta-1,3,5(10)-triene-9,17-dione monooxygenase
MSTTQSANAGQAAYFINDIPPFTSLGGMPLIPEREELIRRASAMVPTLRARTPQTTRERRLPDETVAELHEAGLFNLRKPREYGGFAIDNQTYCDVMSEIARGDGSTAWTVGICNDIWFLGGTVLPAEGRHEFYESGLLGTAPFYPRSGAKAKRVEGGILVGGGEWPWGSGSQVAGWILPRVDLLDDDGNMLDTVVPLIPMEQAEILDEWHTTAMRGSSSNTIKMGEVFVPEHRVGSMSRVLLGHHTPEMPDFQRQPWLTGVIFGIVPIAIGLGRAALEIFLERSPGRPVATTTYMDQSATVRAQLLSAEAAQKIDAADLLLHRGAATLDMWAANGHEPTVPERVKARADFGFAARLCIEAVQSLFRDAGASALAEAHPLSRIAQDINAIAMHAAFNPTTALENYGAALNGHAPPAMAMGDFVFV